MERATTAAIRPFDGSRADAEGILRVEQATFDESPYTAGDVQSMLARGPQQAWLAVEGSCVAGFVTAFLTQGLRGGEWEIDLLAVHPDWRGRGLGSRLIREAAAAGVALARRARAVVGDDNHASARAFAQAGFRARPGRFHLLVERPSAQGSLFRPAGPVTVTELALCDEVREWLAGVRHAGRWAAVADSAGEVPPQGESAPGLTLLVAVEAGRRLGYAELLDVQTLLYRGVWIESLRARSRPAQEALLAHAVERVRAAGWDEIGALVEERNRPLARLLRRAGFRSLGWFHCFVAELPLAEG